MSESRALLSAYLRQRRELGERELFLERHSADELRRVLISPSVPIAGPSRFAGKPERASSVAVDRHAVVSAAAGLAALPGSLESLRAEALHCTRCGLAEARNNVVFGEGDPAADVVVVGEAPGADEDLSGRPFVGRAGKLLNVLLAAVGFPREEVYICNVLKCRPPGNRNPRPEEVEACSPFLARQLEIVGPRVVLACGTFAAQTLLRSNLPISRLRGDVHRFGDVPLIATYHPAALLRNPAWVRSAWEDLQLLRKVFDASPVGAP